MKKIFIISIGLSVILALVVLGQLFSVNQFSAFLSNQQISASTAGTYILAYLVFAVAQLYLQRRIFLLASDATTILGIQTVKGIFNSSEEVNSDRGLVSQLTAEFGRFNGQVTVRVANGLTQLVIMLAVIAYLFTIAPMLTILSIGGLALIVGGSMLILRRVLIRIGSLIRTRIAVYTRYIEALAANRYYIYFYGLKVHQLKSLNFLLGQWLKNTTLLAFYAQITKPISEVSIIIILFLVAAFFGSEFPQLAASLPVFGLASLKLVPAVLALSAVYQGFVSNKATVTQFLDSAKIRKLESSSIEENTDIIAVNELHSVLNVSDLLIYLPDGELLLSATSIKGELGELHVVKGESGSGKTKLLQSILGIYANCSGDVEILGKSPRLLQVREKEKYIAFVPQLVPLIDGTLRENIDFFGAGIDDAEILELCEVLGLSNYLNLESIIDFDGTNISGGQRKRIGIARALVAKQVVLVLDEPTSELDSDTEKLILKILSDRKLCTYILVITHSNAFDTIADQIFTIDNKQLYVK